MEYQAFACLCFNLILAVLLVALVMASSHYAYKKTDLAIFGLVWHYSQYLAVWSLLLFSTILIIGSLYFYFTGQIDGFIVLP